MKDLNCLQKETKDVLERLILIPDLLKNYVLVGGSGLAIQLCHRLSEDLDFFTFADTYNRVNLIESLSVFDDFQIINETKEQIDLVIENIKVTFFNAKWKFLEPRNIENFNICPIDIIAAMKVNVLFSRAKYRDYYDLYFIIKYSLSLNEVYLATNRFLKGINFKLFSTALLFVDDIVEDNINHLSPKENISKIEIADFFKKEIKQIVNQN